MAGTADKNLEQIMARIREQVRMRKPVVGTAVSPSPAPFPVAPSEALALFPLADLQYEVRQCHATHAAVGTLNRRPSGLPNQLAQFVKKAMRRSLTWYTRPLHLFHGSVTRALNETMLALDSIQHNITELQLRWERLDKAQQQVESVVQQHVDRLKTALDAEVGGLPGVSHALGGLRAQVDGLLAELGGLPAELANLRREFDSRSRQSERRLRRLAYEAKQNLPAPNSSTTTAPDMFPSEVHGEAEFDYTGFEDRFRGDEADIRARQAVYLQYFRGCENVLDLGCGRGEFLEILGDNAISASGVESNLDMYLLCRDKRLNVAHQDMFALLNSAPDESLGGVFCSQVIEHLSSANQLLLMELLGRKLKRGAPAVIETINPECLYALAHNFFLDPTHVRPVHPELIRFALQQLDFERVELRFFAPVNSGHRLPQLKSSIVDPNLEQFNHAVQHLNELLYGYQDYAAIAWR